MSSEPSHEPADGVVGSALTSAVEAHHPYDVPCVVAYPATGGSAAYLDWVRDEVAAEGASR